MITVYFYGVLKRYGESFKVDAKNPAEAVRALYVQIPGLKDTLKSGNWHVLRGKLEDQDDDSEESLTVSFGDKAEMHVLPAVEGANGVLNVIIGTALLVAGVMTLNPMLIGAGAGLLLGGIVMMTMQIPTGETNQEASDDKSSFIFNRPVNNSTQGVAIPRGYGRARVGSIVVSTSVTAEQMLEDGSVNTFPAMYNNLYGGY